MPDYREPNWRRHFRKWNLRNKIVMTRNNIEDFYPLSPMQQGMLFDSVLAPESEANIVQVACRLEGLNLKAFERSWQEVINRHAILRTAFAWKSVDQPLQLVGRSVAAKIHYEDWRHLSAEEQDQEIEFFLVKDRARGFDLSKAPLMRWTLIRIGQDAFHFIWSYHHILLDGWSIWLLLKELFAFYDAFC